VTAPTFRCFVYALSSSPPAGKALCKLGILRGSPSVHTGCTTARGRKESDSNSPRRLRRQYTSQHHPCFPLVWTTHQHLTLGTELEAGWCLPVVIAGELELAEPWRRRWPPHLPQGRGQLREPHPWQSASSSHVLCQTDDQDHWHVAGVWEILHALLARGPPQQAGWLEQWQWPSHWLLTHRPAGAKATSQPQRECCSLIDCAPLATEAEKESEGCWRQGLAEV